jgi:hypothetical protein
VVVADHLILLAVLETVISSKDNIYGCMNYWSGKGNKDWDLGRRTRIVSHSIP